MYSPKNAQRTSTRDTVEETVCKSDYKWYVRCIEKNKNTLQVTLNT